MSEVKPLIACGSRPKRKDCNAFLRDVDREHKAVYEVVRALVGLDFNTKRRVLVMVCVHWGIDVGKLAGAIEGGMSWPTNWKVGMGTP